VLREPALALQRHRAAEHAERRPRARIGDPRRERHELTPQRIVQPAHDLAGDSRLVLVDQRVVRLAPVAHALGLGPLERHDLLEVRAKGREVRCHAGGRPGVLRPRGGPGQVLDQLAGEPDEAVVVPPQLPHVHRLWRVGFGEERRSLQLAQQLAKPGIGAALVEQTGHQRELLAPAFDRAGGHLDLLVPLQEGLDRGEHRLVANPPDQLLVRLLGGHAQPFPGSGATDTQSRGSSIASSSASNDPGS
jgi:hypothetical protein